MSAQEQRSFMARNTIVVFHVAIGIYLIDVINDGVDFILEFVTLDTERTVIMTFLRYN